MAERVLVADHAGNIVVINYQNGALMKAMQSHASRGNFETSRSRRSS